MFDSDLCNGFLLGFLTAGVLGFIFQRIRLLNFRAGQANKKMAMVETKQSPAQTYRSSIRAQVEIFIWVMVLILVVVAALWAYLS